MFNTSTSDKCIIKISKNGPYLVSGKIPIIEYEINCDPFCDGTHTNINFNGTETGDIEKFHSQAKEINGPELILKDVEKLCASARFCHRSGDIWEQIPKSDNPEIKKIAISNSYDCPSGRLSLWDKKTGFERKSFEGYYQLIKPIIHILTPANIYLS